jgi:hypothetical protein
LRRTPLNFLSFVLLGSICHLSSQAPLTGNSPAAFREVCALLEAHPDLPEGEQQLLRAAIGIPETALRESSCFLQLPFGPKVFQQLAREAPDEAVAAARAGTDSAAGGREALLASEQPQVRLLGRLAGEPGLDLPTAKRLSFLAGAIASGTLDLPAATRLAREARYFSALADARLTAGASDVRALDRALETEARLLCRAAAQSGAKSMPRDFAAFRATDLYLLLSYGRAEAAESVFSIVFDRLLVPSLRAERPPAASLIRLLAKSGDWALRDFSAAAVAARRLDEFGQVAGAGTLARLALGIDRTADPQKEAIRLAEVIAFTGNRTLLDRLSAAVLSEFARTSRENNARARILYGLLAARLSQTPAAKPELQKAGAPYLPFLKSAESLEIATLFGTSNECVELCLFYDDEDGVDSFNSFVKSYRGDDRWVIEDRDEYVTITGHSPAGRRLEIFANRPIDGHLPANRYRDGEARRRQDAIVTLLKSRGSTPTVIVHRGHSFYTAASVKRVTPAARLVILGSCGGVNDIHGVLELSHEAQVIATRGVGTAEINDPLLKSLNDRVLGESPVIDWSSFWREQTDRLGQHSIFRDYAAPNQEPSAMFLRAYYRVLDSQGL